MDGPQPFMESPESSEHFDEPSTPDHLSELTLTCHLMMGGEMIEMQEVALPANGQDAMFISELFEHDTSDFTGSMRCTALAGERNPEFTGVALELDAMNGIFTTLPVVSLSGHMMSDEEMASEE